MMRSSMFVAGCAQRELVSPIPRGAEYSDSLGPNQTVVVLDLDGTLVDTMQSFARIAGEVLEKYAGLSYTVARDAYLETSGRPFCDQVRLILPGHQHVDIMIRDFERQKAEIIPLATMPESTIRTLKKLRQRGFKFGISSNNQHEHVTQFASRSPVPFDFALGHRGSFKKGSPHFEKVKEMVGCSAKDMLFIGDSLSDAAIACSYGVKFLAVLRTFPRERFEEAFPGVQCIPDVGHLMQALDS